MVTQCMASLQYVCKWELSVFSVVTGRGASPTVLHLEHCANGLNIAESKA